MAVDVDVKFEFDEEKEYWDFNLADNGDFELTKGLDTTLSITFLTNRRADQSEVNRPEGRGGWWGNLFNDNDFQIGSKLWLLNSSPLTQVSLNTAIGYAEDAYRFLVEDGLVDRIIVTGQQSLTSIQLDVKLIIGADVSVTSYSLWRNTNKTVN